MEHDYGLAKFFFGVSLRVFFVLVIVTVTLVQATAQSVNNTSTYVGSGRYKWIVYIDGDPSILKSINYVEYKLRSTFRNPVRRSNNPREGKYPFNTWDYAFDSFNISVTIFYRDNHSQELPSYTVRLKP